MENAAELSFISVCFGYSIVIDNTVGKVVQGKVLRALIEYIKMIALR